MDPESTTTMGEGESDTTERPFHIMKAVERTSAKLRICAASCRGCISAIPSMFAIVVLVVGLEVGVVDAGLVERGSVRREGGCCEFAVERGRTANVRFGVRVWRGVWR